MSNDDFSDAALVLVGHGSTQNTDSGEPVFQHAAELRRRRGFAEVREGFWKQEPRIKQVASQLAAPRVFFVPLFISEGYFSDQVIPEALGFARTEEPASALMQQRGAQTLYYCRAIGTHPSMTEVLLARAQTVISKFPFPRAPQPSHITLFLAGHGTLENSNSRRSVEEQASRIRDRGLYADVQAVFLEEAPRIADCYQMAQTRNIVVVPFFMSDGLHVQEDIPVLLGEPERVVRQRLENRQPTWRNPTERNGKLVWYAPSVGTEPSIAEVILDRVREAAGQ